MGGRGATSSGRGGSAGGGLNGIGGAASAATPADLANEFLNQNTTPDYDGNGNPALQAWQQLSNDDIGHQLHLISQNSSVLAQDPNDPWAYYDSEYQKFVNTMGLHGAPIVMSDTDFKNYCTQTGQTPMYRGWSGQDAANRFEQSPNSHVGNGINGDGYYFSAPGAINTARSYANGSGKQAVITQMALSPSARVVKIDDLRAYNKTLPRKAQKALRTAGTTGTRTYGGNQGDAQLALKLGYNVIDAGWAVIPLTRDACVISSKRVH